MEIYKELPLELQLKIFNIHKKDRYWKKIQEKAVINKAFMLREFKFHAETFTEEDEFNLALFHFVGRWEKNNIIEFEQYMIDDY